MKREQKIKALAEEFDMFEIGYANEEELSKDSFKAGLLAGIRLRDGELLALLVKPSSIIDQPRKF
jgi:hypothetical protein